jgi:tRNA A-37 threonylcarbamoyl transferase component Bud32
LSGDLRRASSFAVCGRPTGPACPCLSPAGRAAATTHSAGLLHHDLHAGNILFRAGDSPRMWLLDLQRAKFHRRLTRRQIVDNLGMFVAGLSAWLDEGQIEQLLHDYAAFSPLPESAIEHRASEQEALHSPNAQCPIPDARSLVADVHAAAARHDAAQLRSRQRDILGNGRYFARVRLPGGWSGHVFLRRRRQQADPGSLAGGLVFSIEQWQAALSDVARLIDGPCGPGERIHRDKPGARVARRSLQVGPHRLDVFVKQRLRRPLAALLDAGRGTRARAAFRQGHRLLMRGLPTPLPLACLVRRRAGVPIESVLITEAADDGVSLHKFVRDQLPLLPAGEQARVRQDVARQIGRAAATLWRTGLVHRDLKPSNILVCHRPGQRPGVLLIDLDGLRHSLGVRSRALARLAEAADELPGVTRTDWFRLVREFYESDSDANALCRRMVRNSPAGK